MQNTRDVTVPGTNPVAGLGNVPRHWLSEESGLVLLTPQGGGTTLRVPVYANARPASEMEADDAAQVPQRPTSQTIELEGDDVATGTEPLGWVSKVSAFELQATSPKATLPAGVSPSSLGTPTSGTSGLR